MIAPADVCTAESRTIEDLNDTLGCGDLTPAERLMLRGLVGSGVDVVPGKRYSLGEIAAIVRAAGQGKRGGSLEPTDGTPFTNGVAAALAGEGPGRPSDVPDSENVRRDRVRAAKASFLRSFARLSESEQIETLELAGCAAEREAVRA